MSAATFVMSILVLIACTMLEFHNRITTIVEDRTVTADRPIYNIDTSNIPPAVAPDRPCTIQRDWEGTVSISFCDLSKRKPQ